LRTEAATAERERLAKSIHDSVPQVLARGERARWRPRNGPHGLSRRSRCALVTTEPVVPSISGTTNLRAALQLLATPTEQVSAPTSR
jgi:hypothetical protein